MITDLATVSFPLAGAAVHIGRDGAASVLQGDAVNAHLQRRPEGYVLGAYAVRMAGDVHPETWEMHPSGDEVLIMLAGELGVEYANGLRRGALVLKPFRAMVVPQGVWHRLALRKPGLLLALSPPSGTRFSRGLGPLA